MCPIMLLCLKKILRVRQIMRYKVLLVWAKLNNVILSSTSKIHIPNMGVNFLFIWKGQVFLWTEFINWRILTWIWKGIIWAVYVSRSTHTPNLELILGNWYLASYKKMKYLESNDIWNFFIAFEISKRVG